MYISPEADHTRPYTAYNLDKDSELHKLQFNAITYVLSNNYMYYIILLLRRKKKKKKELMYLLLHVESFVVEIN